MLELSLVDSIVIFDILERNLRLLLELSELVKILKDQMLAPLLIDLDLNLMLFLEILEFSFLVSELSLFVF